MIHIVQVEQPEGEEGEEGEDEDEDECEPDYIVYKLHNVRARRHKHEFLVEWVGFPEEEHFTWEPRNHLPSEKHKKMIHEFKTAWIAEGKRWPRLR